MRSRPSQGLTRWAGCSFWPVHHRFPMSLDGFFPLRHTPQRLVPNLDDLTDRWKLNRPRGAHRGRVSP